jgi:hypothetical protein
MIVRLIAFLIFFIAVSAPAEAAVYYISPDGNDSNSGLTSEEAWATIDNQTEHMNPGDTVNILPGTYTITKQINLKSPGTAAAPIVYHGFGGRPLITGEIEDDPWLLMSESFIILENIELSGAPQDGISIKKDSCLLSECFLHDINGCGIDIEGSGNLLLRNTIAHIKSYGIRGIKGGLTNKYYGNTIYDALTGINIQVNEKTARIINNIIVSCNQGISGVTGNICAYNLLWDNLAGDYFGGITDSAGGFVADPLFIDTAAHNFRLGFGSPAIDAGIDLGYSFDGPAPDIGAFETGTAINLEIIPVLDTLSADSQYQFIVIAADDAGNPASPGNLTWSHTFTTGSIDSTGLFTPVSIGGGRIGVISDIDGLSAQTDLLYVRAGAPTSISISPDTLTIKAGTTQIFTASGYDKNSNEVTDLGELVWSIDGDIGGIDSTGLFTAHIVGSGVIRLQTSLGFDTTSGTINVIPGDPSYLDILPEENIVPTLETYQYTALIYDADSNLIADYTDSVTWSTTDPGGNITSSGLYTAGPVGDYWINASYETLADSGSVSVVLSGGLDYIRIEYYDGTPVTAVSFSTDNDTTRLYARGYTAAAELIGDLSVDWEIVDADSVADITPDVGTMTELTLSHPGDIRIAVRHSSDLVDTTGIISVVPGLPAYLTISPKNATLPAGATQEFTMIAFDNDDNEAYPQPVPTWSLTDSIGTIDGDGLFTAASIGTTNVVVTAAGLADTSGQVKVVAGTLASLRIEPDSIAVNIGDTIQFAAIGLDIYGNATDPGTITWKALGRVGTIDAGGLYIAQAPGLGAVTAENQSAHLADTTGELRVEELYYSTIPLGNTHIRPDGDEATVAEFRLDNYFSETKTVTSISVRDLCSGSGTAEQLAANMSAARLYLDTDADSIRTAADSLLDDIPYQTDIMTFSIPPIDIPPDSGLIFFVTAKSALYPRDGDTVDIALIPGIDIETADLTIPAGPSFSNSIGIVEIDGMTAGQITTTSLGNASVGSSDTAVLCLVIDIPRNGYRSDTLNGFELVNNGTATENDIDSLLLFADDGNNVWDGVDDETLLGALVFNGQSWSRGGLSLALNNITTRLYIAARITRFPSDGKTINFELPLSGLQVASNNDGPLDLPVIAPDTFTIEGQEAILAAVVPITAHSCIPGQNSGPLLAVTLTNGYADDITLEDWTFTFYGTDPGGATAVQLQSQIDSAYLYLDRDNNISSISSSDSLLAGVALSDGEAIFNTPGLSLDGSGGTFNVIVAAKLNLYNSKNNNTIAFKLLDTLAITCSQAVHFSGTFPLSNAASFTIDAFPAAAVNVNPLEVTNLYAGQVNQPVLDLELPRNGYASDRLTEINLQNSGTISDPDLFENIWLWQDKTDDGFSDDDILIGSFRPNGDRWRLDGINVNLPLLSNRFIVTVSIAGTQTYGGTVRFDIPTGGIKYASGTIGPDDDTVENVTSLLLFPSNRVTVISIPTAGNIAPPGSAGQLLMTFALYNGYAEQTKTLTQLILTNNSHSVGTAAFSDYELGQVSLYRDIDKNRTFDNDSLLGTGLFSDGKLKIDGFSAALSPESLAYFYIVADLPLNTNDADSLSVSVEQPSDFAFTDYVNLNGDLPLSNDEFLIIDGSIRQQYMIFGLNGRSLAPGDTDVVFLAFSPAINGDQDDELNQIVLQNLGDADTASVTNLRLWRDIDGDYELDPTDSELGPFIYNGGAWSLPNLTLPVSETPPILLVSGDIKADALSGATFQASLPILGCEYLSDNDGPIDSTVDAPGVFTISTSNLRVAVQPLSSVYSVGQTINLALSVTNKSAGSLDSIFAEIAATTNPGLVRLDSSSLGPIDLISSETFIWHFYFTALGAGHVSWSLRAFSTSSDDSSAVVSTPSISIQRGISPLSLYILNTTPTTVTEGQTNIFPLSLVCPHPDTGNAASMSLSSLKVHIIDDGEGDILANSVFSRMVIATGSKILAVKQTVPAQSKILFTFDSPLTIIPGTTQNLMLMVDISADASVTNFIISIDSAAWVPFIDHNTGQSVTHSAAVSYPIRTSATRVESPSQQVGISAVSTSLSTANYFQQDVDILRLYFRHTGQIGSSAIQITKLSVAITDSTDAPLAAGGLFDKITLYRQNYLIGNLVPLAYDSAAQEISLSTPLNLNPQQTDSLDVAVSIKPSTDAPGFYMTIADSTCFVVRDLNTSSILLATSDTTLASGSVFPIISSWIAFKYPAEAGLVCPNDISPASVTSGLDSVPLISFAVNYPFPEQYSSVRLTGINTSIIDSIGQPLNPAQMFDRIGIRIGSGSIQYQTLQSQTLGSMTIPFGTEGLLLAPGDSTTIRLYADLRPDMPYTNFAFEIEDLDDIIAVDFSDPEHLPGISIAPNCSESYPFAIAPISVLLPAGRPMIIPPAQKARLAAAGSQNVTLFEAALRYDSPSPLGQIEINGFAAQLKRRLRDELISNDGSSITAAYLEINGDIIGVDTVFASDSIMIAASEPAIINRGDSISIRLTCDLAATAPAGNFVVTFDDSSFLQIVDANLAAAVYPIMPFESYPFKAGEISITAPGLKSSFTNYPNPFNPNHNEATTIGYLLTEDAVVDIDIFTITGELVCQVINHASRPAGTNQSDTWDGRNQDGLLVQPGVYFCRLTATYGSNRVESYRRKIAVIR